MELVIIDEPNLLILAIANNDVASVPPLIGDSINEEPMLIFDDGFILTPLTIALILDREEIWTMMIENRDWDFATLRSDYALAVALRMGTPDMVAKILSRTDWVLPAEFNLQTVLGRWDLNRLENYRRELKSTLETSPFDPSFSAGLHHPIVLAHDAEDIQIQNVRSLIKAGCDLNSRYGEAETTLLDEAISYGDVYLSEFLRTVGAVSHFSGDGYAELVIEAIDAGNVRGMHHLADIGIELNRLDSDGVSSLVRAIAAGNAEILRILIDRGLLPTAEIESSELMSIAAVYGSPAVIECLAEMGWTSMLL
ncbi:MAG: hypothetical protein IPP63_08315 [Chloracidobacterium sp.]|nr:hypothetical protein [Chloracidobacterium sp.]